jgi:propionyl-CoA carboxylase beta chain
MFLTGPKVIKQVTQEDVTSEQLGGAEVHATKSGVAHLVASSEEDAIAQTKTLLTYLPQNNTEAPPRGACTDPIDRISERLNTIIPENPSKPYDMHEVIRLIMDHGEFFEIQPRFAGNLLIGFARLNGRTVGVVANQPSVLAGVLDNNASIKGARFVRTCDAFNIPIVTFEDVPGFMPGTTQEYNGIIRNGAKLLFAFAEATVPKLTVITRKAYGGAYCVMSSKHLRGDVNLAWPTAEIAVMGPDGAVEVIYQDELKKAESPADKRKELKQMYVEMFANPFAAAKKGYIDDVIVPATTRIRLIKGLEMLGTKRDANPPKKHGNIPL